MKGVAKVVMVVVVLFMASNLQAAALVTDLTDGSGGHMFDWNVFGGPPGYETINDWDKIGSVGYQQYFNLTAETDCVEQLATSTQTTKWELKIAGMGVAIPAGTWAGYEWTVPTYSTPEVIKSVYMSGQDYNIGAWPAGLLFQLTDGVGNVLWTSTTNGWVNIGTSAAAPLAIDPALNVTKLRLILTATGSSSTVLYTSYYGRMKTPMQFKTQDAVPEPATLAVLAAGALLGLRRRK